MLAKAALAALTSLLGFAAIVAAPAYATAPTCGGTLILTTYVGATGTANVVCSDADTPSTDLRYTVDSAPTHGTTSPATSAGRIVYRPADGYTGSDHFSVRASDGTDSSAGTVEVDVVVKPPAAPSGCSGGTYPVRAGAPQLLPLGTGVACTEMGGTAPTVVVDTAPAHGSLTGGGAALLYVPDDGFSGTDQLVYHLRNAIGDSAPITATLAVAPGANQAPQCMGPPVTSARNTGAPITVVLSCRDGDLDQGAITIVSGPAHGTLSPVAAQPFAAIADSLMPAVASTQATVAYTPAAGYDGDDSFTYRADDGRGASPVQTMTIHLTDPSSNTAPTCAVGGATAVSGSATGITVGCSDADGDPLTTALVQPPAHGTLTGLGTDGTQVRYVADAGFTGVDSFRIQASDGTASSAAVTGNVTVVDAAHAPASPSLVCGQALNVTRNQTLSADRPFCQAFDGSPVSVAVTSAPAHGTASFDAAGQLTYVPEQNYAGADAFAIKATGGGWSLPFRVLVGVAANARVKIVSGPAVSASDTAPAFGLQAEPGVTLTCSLSDSAHAAPEPCADSVDYPDTPPGAHVFQVTADDGSHTSTDTWRFTVAGPPTGGGSGLPVAGGGGGGGGGGGLPGAGPGQDQPGGSSAPSGAAAPPAPGDAPAPAASPAPAETAPPSHEQIAAAVRKLLRATPPRMGTLRRHGVRVLLDAPTTGRVTIRWYAHAHGHRVLVAKGARRMPAGPARVHIHATRAGRRLLHGAHRRLRVAAHVRFRPTAGRPVNAARRITLRR